MGSKWAWAENGQFMWVPCGFHNVGHTWLKKVRSLLLAGAAENKGFLQQLRLLEGAFKLSVKGLCSQVVREACITLGTYNKLWTEAHEELGDLPSEELPTEPSRPERDRVVFFQRLTTMYVRYIRIFRQLEEAYDRIAEEEADPRRAGWRDGARAGAKE
ncbi:hypothetical protein KOW79_005714 [Hemibagrus wyckioides]|uniref:Uncharacterized protein n=1 Tax=Hemibagrus wyckioides TaxID=337641 RepID=A0A9D3SQJ6_9TELE|nr:hypothetical protein KOW79_005714 [Hemibagrus wyckioides]